MHYQQSPVRCYRLGPCFVSLTNHKSSAVNMRVIDTVDQIQIIVYEAYAAMLCPVQQELPIA